MPVRDSKGRFVPPHALAPVLARELPSEGVLLERVVWLLERLLWHTSGSLGTFAQYQAQLRKEQHRGA